ncbi:hypothetical protein Y023_5257 [Burkholderia pseudomallei A79D]|nr:hypothetical protein Y023_5257 [Burkholderia pseudomallei A79D]KGX96907.1 hypothetical protein X997_4937 [Burkholderia pseudomallei A79C]
MVVTGFRLIAHSPIVARDVITTELAGINSAELFDSPSDVIWRLVSRRYFPPPNRVMSVGVHHGMPPSQNRETVVLGVPPLRIFAS